MLRVYAFVVATTVAAGFLTVGGPANRDPMCSSGIRSNEVTNKDSDEHHRYGCCPNTCEVCLNTDEQCVEHMKSSTEASEACCASRIVGFSKADFDDCKAGKLEKDFCRHIKASQKTSQDTQKGGSGDTMFFPNCEDGVPPCVLGDRFYNFLKAQKNGDAAKKLAEKTGAAPFYKDCNTEQTGPTGKVTQAIPEGLMKDNKKHAAKTGCDDEPKHASAYDREMWAQKCAYAKGKAAGSKVTK